MLNGPRKMLGPGASCMFSAACVRNCPFQWVRLQDISSMQRQRCANTVRADTSVHARTGGTSPRWRLLLVMQELEGRHTWFVLIVLLLVVFLRLIFLLRRVILRLRLIAKAAT